MDWRSGNDHMDRRLEAILTKVLDKSQISLPSSCPECTRTELHMYFHSRGSGKIGGVWIWCSHCRLYYHGSFIAPDWWVNSESIDAELLEAEPNILDKHSSLLDTHFNEVYRKASK